MISLYGGSFDPVHIGHLRIAEDIKEHYGFSKIVFIPAYHSPLKPGSFASPEDRIRMLHLSIKSNPFFSIDDIEIKRKGKSYTVITAEEYRKKLGYYPIFIIGTDAFLSLDRWKDPEKLLEISNFIVVGRKEEGFSSVESYIKAKFPQIKLTRQNKISKNISSVVYYYSCRRIDVSSTEIRDRIKKGRSIKYLVLPEVEDYIFSKKLYRS